MGKLDDEGSESVPLTQRQRSESFASQTSSDSGLSIASAAFLDAHKGELMGPEGEEQRYRDVEDAGEGEPGDDEPFLSARKKAASSNHFRRAIWLLVLLCVGGWGLAFVLFLTQERPSSTAHPSHVSPSSDASHVSEPSHASYPSHTSGSSGSAAADIDLNNPHSVTTGTNTGAPVSLEQVLTGAWSARSHSISWISGPKGEDGLLVERGESKEGYLRVEDVRNHKSKEKYESRVLMHKDNFLVGEEYVHPSETWPSPNLEKVLVASSMTSNWRHSYYAKYWIFDVKTQEAEPLDPSNLSDRVRLASWSPNSDAVVFVRDNNLYLRNLASKTVVAITEDGGDDLFYGVPDWVYEEEVLAGNSGTWWSRDGKHVAFLRTNESSVPDYPVQYFLSNPSGEKPPAELANYPEVRQIKYPKAGSPNPVVTLEFYDVEKHEVFSIQMPEDFADNDRIIIEVVWASQGKVLIRETNRESDVVKIFLVDTTTRQTQLVRSEDIAGLDGGWVEPSQSTRFIPADPENGRPHDGYIDTVIHEGYDHLAYFAPLDNPKPVMLTQGKWEVVSAPSAVDLKRNIVYFVATKEAPTQRHVYQVKIDGTDLRPVTDTSKPGYFDISFSEGSGYALLTFKGPTVPWQSIINTHGDKVETEAVIEENHRITDLMKDHALPTEIYTNVTVDGYTLQAVERRPPNFNPEKKYPVLFFLYGGPGSQTVDRKFTIDFQSYVASSLGYLVVTVDGRGTGHVGRQTRCIIRGKLGQYESRDQIESAKIWASKNYVDETRMAIWGWSYGGFMTLKVLEQDAGRTFQYGMAVAPVTDWRYYGKLILEPHSIDWDYINERQTLFIRRDTCTRPSITPRATITRPSATQPHWVTTPGSC